jgi:homoprotocatechuate degradation regulator HpaR
MSASTPFVHRNLPRLLLQAREAVMAHTRPSLRAHGLSDQQWRVLRVLGEHAHEPAGTETGRVAREAYLLGPSLTGVLMRMERDGLIERERCPQDARRTVVRATALGLDKVQALSQAIEAHYSWMEQQLGKDKLGQIYVLLDEVIALETPATETPDELAEEEER